MRRIVTLWLLGSFGLPACKDHAPSPAETTDLAWTAHEVVVGAGERIAKCADAGVAMQRAYDTNRQAFVDGIALERQQPFPAEVRTYIEDHQDRYADLTTRMEALSERCVNDPAVQAVFREMEGP